VNLRLRPIALVGVFLAGLAAAGQAAPQTARDLYATALSRDQALKAGRTPTLADYRAAISAYDAVVRKYPASGYADNALWQGAALALEAFERFGAERDQATARRLLELLGDQYRFSPLSAKARDALKRMDTTKAPPPPAEAPPPATPARHLALVRDIRRTTTGDKVRVTIELDAPAPYRAESVENPHRMFVDISETRLGGSVPEGTLTYDEEVVRKVRVGRHPNNTTRVVVDLDGVRRYTVSTLTSPFRILVDCERALAAPAPPPEATPAAPPRAPVSAPPPRTVAAVPRPTLGSRPVPQPWSDTATIAPVDTWSLIDHAPPAPAARARPAVPTPGPKPIPPSPPPPTEPAAEPVATPRAPGASPIPPPGSYSLSRQLGLGASRIVIDPGHGGHDPGALGVGVSEAEVVLDVALRLETLLREAGFEVVLTRRTDEFVPLEERPVIATREQADLFLSIHANASRDRTARGIESYILNFANDPDAVAVAVRENASTERRMNNLPEIVKAITLNNKLDESRSFAGLVQRAMAQQLRGASGAVVDHGVKQAPFVVLIGAAMPSVLVEISFITNAQEGRLLKTPAYRQRIAQALFEAVRGYQKSLKLVPPSQQE
jgi:N-acetylmuramoyl-L-alanine amidase